MVSIKGASAIGIFLAVLVLIVLIWNVVYINNIRAILASGVTVGNISQTAAGVIFIVDIILIIITALYLLYNIWIIATTPEQRTNIIQTATLPLNMKTTTTTTTPSTMLTTDVPTMNMYTTGMPTTGMPTASMYTTGIPTASITTARSVPPL